MTQGVITSVLLFRSKKNHPSNIFLALALLAFCLLSSKMLFNSLGLYNIPYLNYFPLGIDFAIAPLVYFYISSLITPNFKFQTKQLLHFVPFLLFQSYAFFIYFITLGLDSREETNALVQDYWHAPIKIWEDYLNIVFIAAYLLIGFFKLKEYRQKINDSISDNTYPTFGWLMKIFILSTILWGIICINMLLDVIFGFHNHYIFHWQIFYIYTAFLIYYLGFVGYQQPNFDIQGIDKPQKPNKQITNEKLTDIKVKLTKSLEQDKVFLNPTLNAKDLAKKLSISQANLSVVVNKVFNKTSAT